MTTTTTHRPGCTRPGWTTEDTGRVAVARCDECGAVELREGVGSLDSEPPSRCSDLRPLSPGHTGSAPGGKRAGQGAAVSGTPGGYLSPDHDRSQLASIVAGQGLALSAHNGIPLGVSRV